MSFDVFRFLVYSALSIFFSLHVGTEGWPVGWTVFGAVGWAFNAGGMLESALTKATRT